MTKSEWHKLNDDARDQALAWHVRLASGDATNADYASFSNWLAEGPDNAKAYVQVEAYSGRVESLGQEYRAQLSSLAERKAIAQPRLLQTFKSIFSPVPLALMTAAATVIVLVSAVLYSGALTPKESIRFAAAQNELHSVALSDGTKVFLGPGAKIEGAYDGSSRKITSFSGIAFFDVESDPTRPFSIALGEKEIRVLGTSFEAAAFDDRISVAVAEGTVAVLDTGERETFLKLGVGQKLVYDKLTSQEQVSDIAPDAVGSWRDGNISFEDADLREISKTLNDFYGRNLFHAASDVDTALRFSGIVALSDPATTARRLTELMAVNAEKTSKGYELSVRSETE